MQGSKSLPEKFRDRFDLSMAACMGKDIRIFIHIITLEHAIIEFSDRP